MTSGNPTMMEPIHWCQRMLINTGRGGTHQESQAGKPGPRAFIWAPGLRPGRVFSPSYVMLPSIVLGPVRDVLHGDEDLIRNVTFTLEGAGIEDQPPKSDSYEFMLNLTILHHLFFRKNPFQQLT